ncbi:Hypothetical_protein [Hexamita inflata]|uniref:Hypothetical_protein n=1 Tax=Hexamita inflata TaxID=28002 RepID=A0AA86N7B7_9EUKA|nr:Hypothetical protein HINF_LOCUS1810 [Hexamita inflata]
MQTQEKQQKFKEAVLKMLTKVFDGVQFQTLAEALIHYKKCLIQDNKRIRTNFQQISLECGLTEKECANMFRAELDNLGQRWPEETVNKITQRIEQLWQELPESDNQKKKQQIRELIEKEFQLRQQVEYSNKEIRNKIDYTLKLLTK